MITHEKMNQGRRGKKDPNIATESDTREKIPVDYDNAIQELFHKTTSSNTRHNTLEMIPRSIDTSSRADHCGGGGGSGGRNSQEVQASGGSDQVTRKCVALGDDVSHSHGNDQLNFDSDDSYFELGSPTKTKTTTTRTRSKSPKIIPECSKFGGFGDDESDNSSTRSDDDELNLDSDGDDSYFELGSQKCANQKIPNKKCDAASGDKPKSNDKWNFESDDSFFELDSRTEDTDANKFEQDENNEYASSSVQSHHKQTERLRGTSESEKTLLKAKPIKVAHHTKVHAQKTLKTILQIKRSTKKTQNMTNNGDESIKDRNDLQVDQKVFAKERGQTYEAIIKEINERYSCNSNEEKYRTYFIHFKGWSQRHDKWMKECDILPNTEESAWLAAASKQRMKEEIKDRKQKKLQKFRAEKNRKGRKNSLIKIRKWTCDTQPLTSSTISSIEGSNGLEGEHTYLNLIYSVSL